MDSKKKFKIEDVVSVTSGVLLASMDGIYEVMGHIKGRSLYTHELPAWSNDVTLAIYAQHPALMKVVKFSRKGLGDDMVRMAIGQYIIRLRKEFGDELELETKLQDQAEPLHGKRILSR